MAKGQELRFDLDESDLKLFSEEAEEQIELLDQSLVQLEGEPDRELVQRIFRAAHTLKGSAATIGHRKMASVTHAMETALDQVRQGELRPTRPVVDALLAGVDAIRVLAREVETLVDSGLDVTAVEAELAAVIAGAPAEAPQARTPGTELKVSEAERAALETEVANGRRALRLRAEVAPDCPLPGIRCFQVLQELDTIGMVVATAPPREVVEAGGAEFALDAILATGADDDAVRAAVLSVPDIARMELGPFEARTATTPQPPAGEPEAAARTSGPGPVVKDAAPARRSAQSVRIDVERLDGLMNLVGELVIDRTRLQQIRDGLAGALKDANLTQLTENFEETTAHLARITDELQEEIMRSRMLPVRSVLTRLPRLVRDVAAKGGKQVELVIAGEETELDRSVVEEISDPLVHILRNAVDHGIETPDERRAAGKPETGTIRVTAWNQESSIYLSIRDDGRGLNLGRLREKAAERGLVPRDVAQAASDDAVTQYIFLAGLSTASVVSDVSGRGVGMDIVRTNIERLNGHVTVHTTPGEGSEFVIQLPLTLATTKALMVTANGVVYAMPLVSVTEALAIADADIHSAGGQRLLRLRGQLLPVVALARALGDRRESTADGARYIVAARHGQRQVAFVVDRLLGEQDVVVKSLGAIIGSPRGITGATILGDGTFGLIIDTASLVSFEPTGRAARRAS